MESTRQPGQAENEVTDKSIRAPKPEEEEKTGTETQKPRPEPRGGTEEDERITSQDIERSIDRERKAG